MPPPTFQVSNMKILKCIYTLRASFTLQFSIHKMKRQALLNCLPKKYEHQFSGTKQIKLSDFISETLATSGMHGSVGTLIASFKYQLKSLWNAKAVLLTACQPVPVQISPQGFLGAYPKASCLSLNCELPFGQVFPEVIKLLREVG